MSDRPVASHDPASETDKARWAHKIRQSITPDPAFLRQAAEAIRNLSGRRDRKEIPIADYHVFAMDLICDAMFRGAFSAPEWMGYRVRLASNPSFETAVTLLKSEATFRIAGADQDGRPFTDDGTWEITCQIHRSAEVIESASQTAHPVVSETKSAAKESAAIEPPQADDPVLPKHSTLSEIWQAYPHLDDGAKERIRKNLENAVRRSPSLGIKTRIAGGEGENAYDAQLVRDHVARDHQKHGK
jgi:hypothetical protein